MTRHAGLQPHRLKDNPEEERFAKAWAEQNKHGNNLAYLLDSASGGNGRPADASPRDEVVAATVIQWLGSPVGQAFLEELGYTKPAKTK